MLIYHWLGLHVIYIVTCIPHLFGNYLKENKCLKLKIQNCHVKRAILISSHHEHLFPPYEWFHHPLCFGKWKTVHRRVSDHKVLAWSCQVNYVSKKWNKTHGIFSLRGETPWNAHQNISWTHDCFISYGHLCWLLQSIFRVTISNRIISPPACNVYSQLVRSTVAFPGGLVPPLSAINTA